MTRKISLYAVITALTVAVSMVFIIHNGSFFRY